MVRRGRRYGYGGGDEADPDGWTRGFDMVLNVPGAPGDSELEGHEQWITLLAWSWGISRGSHDQKKPIRILNAIGAKKEAIAKQAVKTFRQMKREEDAKKKNNNKKAKQPSTATDTTAATTATTATTLVGNGSLANGIGSQTEKKENGSEVSTLNKQVNGDGNGNGNGNGDGCAQHGQDGEIPAATPAGAESAADGNGDVDDGDGDEDGSNYGRGYYIDEQEFVARALSEYDSDNDDDNQFDDSEVRPARRSKPNLQNLSMTKYVDIASPPIMLKCLSKEATFDCTLRICKRREIKKPKSDSDSTDSKADAETVKKPETAAKIFGLDEKSADEDAKDGKEAEEKKEFETVVMQEFLLQDCCIESVSTGGSGGEDRLTENISVSFSRVLFTYTDHLGSAPRGTRGEIPTKTIYYDSLRHKAMALDQAVANAIEDQRKLAPVSTVLLDYLNLRSKPNTATATR